jgi:hypothetical protein
MSPITIQQAREVGEMLLPAFKEAVRTEVVVLLAEHRAMVDRHLAAQDEAIKQIAKQVNRVDKRNWKILLAIIGITSAGTATVTRFFSWFFR